MFELLAGMDATRRATLWSVGATATPRRRARSKRSRVRAMGTLVAAAIGTHAKPAGARRARAGLGRRAWQ